MVVLDRAQLRPVALSAAWAMMRAMARQVVGLISSPERWQSALPLRSVRRKATAISQVLLFSQQGHDGGVVPAKMP